MLLRSIGRRLHLDNLKLVVLHFLVIVGVSAVVRRQLFASSSTSSATANDDAHNLKGDATKDNTNDNQEESRLQKDLDKVGKEVAQAVAEVLDLAGAVRRTRRNLRTALVSSLLVVVVVMIVVSQSLALANASLKTSIGAEGRDAVGTFAGLLAALVVVLLVRRARLVDHALDETPETTGFLAVRLVVVVLLLLLGSWVEDGAGVVVLSTSNDRLASNRERVDRLDSAVGRVLGHDELHNGGADVLVVLNRLALDLGEAHKEANFAVRKTVDSLHAEGIVRDLGAEGVDGHDLGGEANLERDDAGRKRVDELVDMIRVVKVRRHVHRERKGLSLDGSESYGILLLSVEWDILAIDGKSAVLLVELDVDGNVGFALEQELVVCLIVNEVIDAGKMNGDVTLIKQLRTTI